jgi:hypothetical protein
MKETDRLKVEEILRQVPEIADASAPSEEKVSMAEAVFDLLASQKFLNAVVMNDVLGREGFEVSLGDYRWENKPKTTFNEKIVLRISPGPGYYGQDGERWSYALSGRTWMVVNVGRVNNPRNISTIVREWIDVSYGNEFDLYGDPSESSANKWGFNVEHRYYTAGDLATVHGEKLQEIFDALKGLL